MNRKYLGKVEIACFAICFVLFLAMRCMIFGVFFERSLKEKKDKVRYMARYLWTVFEQGFNVKRINGWMDRRILIVCPFACNNDY